MKSQDFYLDNAKRCEFLAHGMTMSDNRRAMLTAAETWRRLAFQAGCQERAEALQPSVPEAVTSPEPPTPEAVNHEAPQVIPQVATPHQSKVDRRLALEAWLREVETTRKFP